MQFLNVWVLLHPFFQRGVTIEIEGHFGARCDLTKCQTRDPYSGHKVKADSSFEESMRLIPGKDVKPKKRAIFFSMNVQ